MATRGNRSGSLQDGAIVPSELLTSQKGTPLLVHPMLHPNIGSPRDAATLGVIGSVYPATHASPLQSVLFIWFSHLPSMGGSALFLPIRFLLVWPSTQIVIAGTVRSAPSPVRVWLNSPLWKRVIAWERSCAPSGYGII